MKIKKNNVLSKILNIFKEMLAVTLSAQIMIFPVMLYHFNNIGIYFIITNILVSIITGPIMFLSIIFVFTSFINLEISKFISIFLTLGIKCFIQIANFANLQLSEIHITTPSILSIILYYIVILTISQIYGIYTSKKITNTQKRVKNIISLIKYNGYQKKKVLLKLVKKIVKEKNIKLFILKTYKIIFIIIILIGIYVFNQNLKIYFIDVGQGDSCFIVTPKGRTILIDGGGSSSSTFDVGKDTLMPYILDRGYKKIDYIFISHFDQDHVGGILTVLEELKIGKIYITKQGEMSENYKKFLKIVEQRKIKVQEISAGDMIVIEDLYFKILWPVEQQIKDNILNNNAMVMKLQYKDFSMLFTGDIEEIAEREILDKYKNNLEKLNADILKVAHHGSKSSSTEEFLKAINSKIAIIGVGENNMFGHPNSDIIKRLENFGMQIFRTDESGEICININRKSEVTVRRFIKK